MRVEEQIRAGKKSRAPKAESPPGPGKARRRAPIGAELLPEGGVHFRLWATKCKRVQVQVSSGARFAAEAMQEFELEPEAGGYFSRHVPAAEAGMLYKFKTR